MDAGLWNSSGGTVGFIPEAFWLSATPNSSGILLFLLFIHSFNNSAYPSMWALEQARGIQ